MNVGETTQESSFTGQNLACELLNKAEPYINKEKIAFFFLQKPALQEVNARPKNDQFHISPAASPEV